MALKKEQKTKVIGSYRSHETDTGSPEVQVALLTERIQYLTKHFSTHKKDFNSQRGLTVLISRRKRLLTYLKRCSQEKYNKLVQRLNLRG